MSDHEIKFRGVVVSLPFEGGFWGLESTDGKKYFAVNGLPSHLQKEGIRVRVIATPSEAITMFMWGKSIFVKEIFEE